MASRINLIAIAGQTASGKSALAMRLAQEFGGEIICADSRTVYKEMDIATAKPSPEDQQLVRHWCLDLVAPGERFTVHDFQQAAKQAIANIHSRGKVAFLVGGSGLYFDAVLYDLHFRDVLATDEFGALTDDELRQQATEKFGSLSEDTLGNRRYLVKALQTGQKPRSLQERVLPQNISYIGLQLSREALESKIRARVGAMIDSRLVEEARRMLKVPPEPGSPTAIAYRSLAGYLAGEEPLEEAINKFIQGDIKLSKKQITWFKRDPNIRWFDNSDEAYDYLKQLLTKTS